ncbi:MAG: hypothetical protein GY754_16595 [bacterium]|nr:hypothetical protein [bacterium]
MKLTLEQIQQVLVNYSGEVDIKYFFDIRLKGHKFLSSDLILVDHLAVFRKYGLKEIEVFYTISLYEYLSREFPTEFRIPYEYLNFMDMDRKLEALEKVNASTKRKRFLYMIGDIYRNDTKEGRAIVLRHNEPLTYQKWNAVKPSLNKNDNFQYRNSEVPIIIFVDLTTNAAEDFVVRFKKNTDLISFIVSRKKKHSYKIAPGFVPTEDVVSVTDPATLLDEYIRTNARLIIIGENLNETYKKALIKVKEYDKYVRMMLIPAIDHSNLEHFIHQVKLVYNSDRWSL